ncbi:hypothetical protein N7508_007165 [Penicillium antarcticum]|uniref:uncharacterized protein n=1 Tax=Penicillium antarcticum TaxID=416450 RepID=UPI00239558CE|nr:uncharacterized protein N7508_007165 [Penicillium antarcticum]KAJ5302302.1 hypothetical protein N7508_007165 [Penicillium antarcticum]
MPYEAQYQNSEAVPSATTILQDNANTARYKCDIFFLVEKLLHQEQQSKYYQGRLEFRIHTDSVTYQKLHAYCMMLERSVSGSQHQRSQLEVSLRHATETCQVMSQSVRLEMDKVRELESRLNGLYPSVDSWLERLDKSRQKSESVDDRGTLEHLLSENQRQRESIDCLQSILHTREQTVQDLQATLDQLTQQLPQENTGEDGVFGSHGPAVRSSEESSAEIITETPFT